MITTTTAATTARFSFRETVAGHFGRAFKRNMRNVGAPESVARAGVLEWTFDG